MLLDLMLGLAWAKHVRTPAKGAMATGSYSALRCGGVADHAKSAYHRALERTTEQTMESIRGAVDWTLTISVSAPAA